MVCGSLALELKWMRRDLKEFEETVGVRGRKLEAEILALRRELGDVPKEEDEQVQMQHKKTVRAMQAVGEPSRRVPAAAPVTATAGVVDGVPGALATPKRIAIY
ncbi:hypothetical protein HKX48_002153 [Thoreauomyces humboldtii]|nr:hypothetical protein HKX48_002153 [Thoreauomyces humboldtii]